MEFHITKHILEHPDKDWIDIEINHPGCDCRLVATMEMSTSGRITIYNSRANEFTGYTIQSLKQEIVREINTLPCPSCGVFTPLP